MKLASVVVFYNPSEENIKNIDNYKTSVDTVYVVDNSEDDIDATYGAYGIQVENSENEKLVNLKFPYDKSAGTYTLATTSDLGNYLSLQDAGDQVTFSYSNGVLTITPKS